MGHVGDKHSYEYYKIQKMLPTDEELKMGSELWKTTKAFIKAQVLSDQAKKHKAWLFDSQDKRWYNPEEFFKETNGLPDDAEIFKNIQIRDPIQGISAGFKQIAILQGKISELTKKVISYYK